MNSFSAGQKSTTTFETLIFPLNASERARFSRDGAPKMAQKDAAASPSFSELLASVEEIASLARTSEVAPEAFGQFAAFVGKFSPILEGLKEIEIFGKPPLRKAVESLEAELNRARIIVRDLNSKASVTTIEEITHDLGRCLGLVLLASLDVSLEIKEKIGALHKEMMNAKFDKFDAEPSQYSEIEEEGSALDVEDIALLLKNGSDEEYRVALSELSRLIRDELLSNEWIVEKDIISILLNRMGTAKHEQRLSTILILRSLASENEENKEKMADFGYLTTIVKSLTRDVEERREVVGLLLSLLEIKKVRQRIGKVQGCIVMLVSMLSDDDPCGSCDAKKILTALSGNTQNVLHMAEAGYFKPLVLYLIKGSDMDKILMATALSRMELTDQSKAALGDEGAIEPLVKMFNSGKLEAKLSALTALQSLSILTGNVKRLIDSGIVSPLLQLLFSVTSVLMTLREPASAILASIAQSELILLKHDVAQQMLSLLNLSSPVIQYHLLRALSSITSHSSASKIRAKMKENGAVQLLLPFLSETNTEIRTVTLTFLFNVSKDLSTDLTEQLGEINLNIIANIISSTTSENEKAAALGLLSILPVNNKQATEVLKRANLLPTLLSVLGMVETTTLMPTRVCLLESIAGVLVRFTVSSDKKLQRYSAEHGIIPCLVKLLSLGSPIAKARAATCLAQLSHNSLSLSKAKSLKWLCVSPSSDTFCDVHDGTCFVKSTFCLLKSGAVSPLVQTLVGKEGEADEAVLTALATLLQDEIWENGSKAIVNASGVQAIIRVLDVGSGKALEKAIWMLERIFRIEKYRVQYGESSQSILIDLAQNGDPTLKPMIAKILAHLQLLPMQSSYF